MSAGTFVFKRKDLLYICVAVLLFFQIYLQTIIAPFQYFDELVTVVCLLEIVLDIIKGRLKKKDTSLLIIICLIAAVGAISNVIAGVQTGLKPILTDVGNTFKVFIVYMGADTILTRGSDKKKIVKSIAVAIKIFVTIAFMFMLFHELHIVVMGKDVRYGINSFQFINDGAGQLSMMFYSVVFILTLDMKYQNKTDKLNVFMIMALIVWVSTLRSRAFMYVFVYLFLYWIVVKKNRQIKFSIGNVIAIAGTLIFFGMDQFETYFSNTATARSNLLRYGIYTMWRFFPIGSGFATYGTDAAVTYYSRLYVEYGFENVYGLSKGNAMFAHDTYWPAIIAQFGIIGLILMIVLVLKVCKDMIKKSKGNSLPYFIALFICITQVSSSVATATFFHFVTVALFFMVPLMFADEEAN